MLARVRALPRRGLRAVGRTRVGRELAAGLAGLPPAVPVETSAVARADVVDLGHRLILGRAPSAPLRAALLADLDAGRVSTADALAGLAGSPEFTARVAQQRAIVAATTPAPDDSLLRVEDVRDAQSIEAHNASAEGYFASRDDDTVEQMLAKPFTTVAETTELLTCFGHMVDGLQVVAGDRLLDFGVGTGWTSWMFAQLRAEVVCVDVSTSALDHARRRFARWSLSPGRVDPSFLAFDGHRLDLPDDSVDKICCFDAFHHLVNQADVMAEFARVLRPGGLLGFDEPGGHHSTSPQAQYEMRTFGVIEGDIEIREMAELAGAAGLEFVAADVMTVRPVWVPLERFADLVTHQVLDADTAQRVANQVLTKQQFILRKPGGTGLDSRSSHALAAVLALDDVRVERAPTGDTVHLAVRVHNTGTARWLPAAREFGAVRLGAKAPGDPTWEGRFTVEGGDLTLAPGETRVVAATIELPARALGATLLVNLVSERVTWFDMVGTRPIEVALAPDPG